MVILGGMGSVWGAIVGGMLLAYLDQEGLAKIGTAVGINDVPKYSFGIYGVIIVLMMLFRPTGLIAEQRRKAEMEEGARHALYDVSTEGADTYRGPETDLLVADGVRKEFGGLVAVNDVDFVIPSGSIVSPIGPNGAGKTTFFNMLTGVYKPTAGTITFDEHNVTGKPPHVITQRGSAARFRTSACSSR